FSDFDHHALAVPQIGPGKGQPNEDLGLALTTGNASDDYKFRTPALRNVALTGPYMHDGCYTTLDAVVRHHNDPAKGLRTFDPSPLRPDFAATLDTDAARNAARIAAIDPALLGQVPLSDPEVSDIVAFLQSLTDSTSVQRARAGKPGTVPSGL